MKLSLIIPTYNCREYLDECLMSVINRMTDDIELIAVDDGSDDGTLDLLAPYKDMENVKVTALEHRGASHARNAGLDIAEGSYATFMDCDDTLCEDFFKNSLPLIDRELDLYIFGFVRRYFDGKKKVQSLDNREYENISAFSDDFVRKGQMLIYSACNKFYRRDVIEENNIRFDESYAFGEDRLFNYSYLKYIDKIMTSDIIMFNYNQRSLTSMSTKTVPGYFDLAKMLHDKKVKCFLELSKGTTEEERKSFVENDLMVEIKMTIDRFDEHPNEKEENLPKIIDMLNDDNAPRDSIKKILQENNL